MSSQIDQVLLWPSNYDPESLLTDVPNEGIMLNGDGISCMFTDYNGFVIYDWGDDQITIPLIDNTNMSLCRDTYANAYKEIVRIVSVVGNRIPIPQLHTQLVAVLKAMGWIEMKYEESVVEGKAIFWEKK